MLRTTDNLSKTLQKKELSAAQGQLVAAKTKIVLRSMRNEEHFDQLWEKLSLMLSTVEVSAPVLPRRRKVPRRFELGIAPPEYDSSPKDMYRRIYFEALDLLVQAINKRFDQPGYHVYCSLENIFLKVFKKENYSDEMKAVLDIYGDDLNASNLADQLRTYCLFKKYFTCGERTDT